MSSMIECAQPKTERRLERIGRYIEVPWGCYRVGTSPMVSFGYSNCRALVLENDETSALTHFFSDQYPQFHLGRILYEMKARPHELKGVVVSGYCPEEIEEYCTGIGINMLNLGGATSFGNTGRDVIVAERKVFIYASTGEDFAVDMNKSAISRIWDDYYYQNYFEYVANMLNRS